jgi:hypothetical protein
MSKAFDCVVHEIVLLQLERYGIRGVAQTLFKSYLCNRQQATIIKTYNRDTKTVEQIQSDFDTVKLGVPQGSVIGPLLFLIYINELPDVVDELCVLFADDATILFSGKYSPTELQSKINSTLITAVQWLQSVNLTVNLKKTKITQFRNYVTTPLPLIIDYSTEIQEVDSFNFLGVSIDPHLNWKSQIEKINKKISSGCYALSILSETCSESVVVNAYFGSVYPLLTYGIIYWGNSINVQSTFVLQKKCLRTIYRMDARQTLRNVFKEKRFLTLTGLYLLELCIFVKTHSYYFVKKSSLRGNLRPQYQFDLVLPKVNNSMYKRSAYITAIKVFNHLPAYLKKLEGKEFKTKLKNWLLDKVFYNINEFYNSNHIT